MGITREEAKELLPFIQAFAEGKTIQVWTNDTWKDEDCPFFGPLCQFRIKPELKYRPFKTQEECWNEMLKHQPFGWVRNKNYQTLLWNVTSIDNDTITIMCDDYNDCYNFCKAFACFEFIDGAPFGIKED